LILYQSLANRISEHAINAQKITKLNCMHAQHASRNYYARKCHQNAAIVISRTQRMIEIASTFEHYQSRIDQIRKIIYE
jgi:hypothetical protein